MIELISENWLLYVIALAIGLATAYWAWVLYDREDSSDRFDADDGLLKKADEAAVPTPESAAPSPAPAPMPKAAAETKTAAPASGAAKATAIAAGAPKPVAKAKPRPRAKPAATETAAPTGKPKIAKAKGSPDNLRLIKGVGPKLNTLLNNLGVTRFDQIAAWKEQEIAEVDKYLENFSGRITRDNWIDQAKYLAKDDIAGFEKKYGAL